MTPFLKHTGIVACLPSANIDTDIIIPKQYLTAVSRTGLGKGLFHNWRYHEDGSDNDAFILNDPRYSSASILVVGANFGCGSSREHAPWALKDFGIRCIIAPSFADIFYNNCLKNGLLPAIVEDDAWKQVFDRVEGSLVAFTVDLEAQRISDSELLNVSFKIQPTVKDQLLSGRDEIDDTLSRTSAIEAFEKNERSNT